MSLTVYHLSNCHLERLSPVCNCRNFDLAGFSNFSPLFIIFVTDYRLLGITDLVDMNSVTGTVAVILLCE